jgi:putative membrane protein insertion efficiency factor
MPSLLRSLFLGIIRGYQLTLSPDHGLLKVFFPHGICRFTPTCSEYLSDAISQYGWRGWLLGARRLARCHPLSPGGIDPV